MVVSTGILLMLQLQRYFENNGYIDLLREKCKVRKTAVRHLEYFPTDKSKGILNYKRYSVKPE